MHAAELIVARYVELQLREIGDAAWISGTRSRCSINTILRIQVVVPGPFR
jgi:hypothetical protein